MAETAAGGTHLSSQEDSLTFLTTLIALPPSMEAVTQLAISPICLSMIAPEADSQLAALFLKAAAIHLNAAFDSVEGENERTQPYILNVLATVGSAATHCVKTMTSRSLLAKSGILISLVSMLNRQRHIITAAHVEFLQCAILAGHYRFARRMVGDTWPRPNKTTTVEHLLRYYYLRGLMHIGCDEFNWAIRCFWTVLSVPMTVVSAIAVEAWKRMVLCQCLIIPINDVKSPYPSLLALPAASSKVLARFMSTNNNSPEIETSDHQQHQQQQLGSDSHNHHAANMGIPAYVEVAKALVLGDRTLFLKIKTKYAVQWTADKTMGLMERLETEMLHRHVQKLASIYSVIPISQLSTELEIPVEQLPTILPHVQGLLVTEQDGMVSLERIATEPMPKENLSELMVLTERIRKLDVTLSTSRQFRQLKGDISAVMWGRPQGVEEF